MTESFLGTLRHFCHKGGFLLVLGGACKQCLIALTDNAGCVGIATIELKGKASGGRSVVSFQRAYE
jgi:hypothetical protein